MKKKSVLFVCLGNICRSPLAEGLVRHMAETGEFAGRVEFDSAGTSNWHIGEPPHEKSQKTAKNRGTDISVQQCRQLNADDFEKFDLILGMDQNNVANIARAAPENGKAEIALFLDYASKGNIPVPDPWGEGDDAYEQVADMIEDAAPAILKRLFS